MKLQLEFRGKNVVLLGMRLTNPSSAGVPGLAEIRKEKKTPQLLRERRPVEKIER